jgi:hypothetical protein
MAKRPKEGRGRHPQVRANEPRTTGAPLEPRAGHKASRWERFVKWLNPASREEVEEDRVLNESHDRSEVRWQERAPKAMAAHRQGADLEESNQFDGSALFVEMRKLQSKHEALEDRLNRLQAQVNQLGSAVDDVYYGHHRPKQQPEVDRQDPVKTHPPNSTPPKADHASASHGNANVRLDSLERAVTDSLQASDLGSLEVDELRRTVQRQLGGAQIDLQLLGRQRQDGWQMLLLFSPQSHEGVLLVSPGELVDTEVAQYFEGEYGRRIRSCRMPALVRREGSGLTLVRKGRVEIS